MTGYILKTLQNTSDTTSFDCGDSDLNEFLKEDAVNNKNDWLSVTKILCEDEKIIGFFTITPDTLHKGRINLQDKLQGYQYGKYPAIKLARLAVDKQYQGKGIGKLLMKSFFKIARDIVDFEGGRFITVDAKQNAVTYYRQYGFVHALGKANETIVPMYLDFHAFYQKSMEKQ